jgi:uncharacterized protein YjeT (DUF2065 family)
MHSCPRHPFDYISHTTLAQEEVIITFSVTIIVEGIVAGSCAVLYKKPVLHLLFSCLLANLLTQPLLWLVLQVFIQHYLMALFIAEFWIWVVEGVILFLYPYNRLRLRDALGLSLAMNLASFAAGWFLPI